MHGRVKVRTSEEQKAHKEKERQEKLKLFKHAMSKVFEKRKNYELDKELLDITAKVLTSNPDIYTLWNIRREIISLFRKTEELAEELPQICDAELQLTECCLKINPKSYCAWHQREWILTTRPDPDWKKELTICNTYLKLDERNFHTWDYRRFVVSQYKPPLEEEFDFTTEKLYDNFSNYSAWHYRSKMLVALYPDLEGGRPIEESHHKHELKMVQSAAFTDPDDTSAWFYQRWLLGAVRKSIALVVCTVTISEISLAFSENVSKYFVGSKIVLLLDDKAVVGNWVSATGNAFDVLWVMKHEEDITEDTDIKVHTIEDDVKQTIQCSKQGPNMFIGRNAINFQNEYPASVLDELNNQLNSCRQLLALEPDSKWTLLTTTVFLRCINAKLYHKEVMSNLYKLKNIDKLRKGYYDDLISKWSIEDQLSKDYSGNNYKFQILFHEKITCLPHLQYYSYCINVDLSNQELSSRVLPSLVMLPHCKILSLANNRLNSLKGFPQLNLQELNISGNHELNEDEVIDMHLVEVQTCKVIKN